jgi:cyclophilin family peptidyl-prolyl cis-trans isomerase
MTGQKIRTIIAILILSSTLLAIGCAGQANSPDTSSTSTSSKPPATSSFTQVSSPKPKTYSAYPPMIIDQNKTYTATLQTEKGNLVIELFAKDVPKAVNNFVFLSRDGYYDNTTFHRVLSGFMAQAGDPTGTGFGGPGYSFGYEITQHKHVGGSVSMAHSSLPDSNGSQFFICYAAQPHLDGGYSVFGQLIQGMDVLKKLTPRNPDENPTFTGDKLIRVTIEEK